MASPLKGRRVLITSGPTREYLDPIRFLSNGSSGRMGFALARSARRRGARVTVVSGPVALSKPRGVEVIGVETAMEMRREAVRRAAAAHVVIGAAAVGDWRFAEESSRKLKRSARGLTIRLVPNPDVLLELSRMASRESGHRLGRRHPGRDLGSRHMGRRGRRAARRVVVGFALETDRWIEHALEKLKRKGLDLVVANRIDSLGGAEGQAAVIGRDGGFVRLPPSSKDRLAARILDEVERFL